MLIGYARVSRQDQNLELQLEALREYGCQRIYQEKRSGKDMDSRTELQELLRFVRNGDVVVVCKLDRLARSLTDMLTIVDEIDGRQAGLKSLAESVIDTTSSAGRLVFQMFAVVAEFERARLRERTMEGLARARADGKMFGRPKALTAVQTAQIKQLKANGESYQALADSFGVSKTSIYRYCKTA